LKKDILGVEDIFSPFHVMDTNFIARSMITHRVSGITVDSKQPYTLTKPYKYNRVFIGSDDLQDMYWFALFAGKITATNYARLIFEIKDSLRFSPPKRAPNSFKLSAYKTYDNWADSNLYCYDLVLPKLTTDSLIRQYMISDLNRYFNFNGRLERRTIDCFVIQKQDTAKETDSISPNKIEIAILASAKTEPIPSSGLADYFNARIYLGYIIDESNLPPGSTINLELKYRALKPDQIAAMLRQSKLVLIKSKRMVSVYVVSEN
jgi:hypothetical protein